MEVIGYIAALLMGSVLGMLGGGGAILTVPILVYLFKLPAVAATEISLLVVGASALFGTINYIRRGQVSYKIAFFFGAPGLVGVNFARKFLLPAIPDPLLTSPLLLTKNSFILILFAALMIAAARAMLKSQFSAQASAQHRTLLAAIPRGFFVGGLTGLIGAGGGFLIVPALVNIMRLTMRTAVGTSLLIISVNSLFGFAISARENFNWKFAVTFSIASLIGIAFGTKIAPNIPEKKLKVSFGILILVVGSGILLSQIF